MVWSRCATRVARCRATDGQAFLASGHRHAGCCAIVPRAVTSAEAKRNQGFARRWRTRWRSNRLASSEARPAPPALKSSSSASELLDLRVASAPCR
eukprot:904804-Alexandrium_andersonii.AAC.1